MYVIYIYIHTHIHCIIFHSPSSSPHFQLHVHMQTAVLVQGSWSMARFLWINKNFMSYKRMHLQETLKGAGEDAAFIPLCLSTWKLYGGFCCGSLDAMANIRGCAQLLPFLIDHVPRESRAYTVHPVYVAWVIKTVESGRLDSFCHSTVGKSTVREMFRSWVWFPLTTWLFFLLLHCHLLFSRK